MASKKIQQNPIYYLIAYGQKFYHQGLKNPGQLPGYHQPLTNIVAVMAAMLLLENAEFKKAMKNLTFRTHDRRLSLRYLNFKNQHPWGRPVHFTGVPLRVTLAEHAKRGRTYAENLELLWGADPWTPEDLERFHLERLEYIWDNDDPEFWLNLPSHQPPSPPEVVGPYSWIEGEVEWDEPDIWRLVPAFIFPILFLIIHFLMLIMYN